MPSTARLLRADGSDKIHAFKPAEDVTLCGLLVVTTEDWKDSGIPPLRSADATSVRFYEGVSRLMCNKCCTRAPQVRIQLVSIPLDELVVVGSR